MERDEVMSIVCNSYNVMDLKFEDLDKRGERTYDALKVLGVIVEKQVKAIIHLQKVLKTQEQVNFAVVKEFEIIKHQINK